MNFFHYFYDNRRITMRHLNYLGRNLAGCLLALLGGLLALPVTAQAAEASTKSVTAFTALPGASVTHLPDGRWLLAGGLKDGKATTELVTYDPATHRHTTLSVQLLHARAHHTSTVLPDGRVFIFGGVDRDNVTLGSAEVLDVARGKLSRADHPGLLARAHHSATLLTNGTVLVFGGHSQRGDTLGQAELWDPRGMEQSLPFDHPPGLERSHAVARLLPDGNVLYQGGFSRAEIPVSSDLLFHAAEARFEPVSFADSARQGSALTSSAPLTVTATLPAANSRNFLPGAQIVMRFSRPVDVTTVNTRTLALIGPAGAVAATVVPAQDGMLAFLTPVVDLFPATRYTLIATGIVDAAGLQTLTFEALSFIDPALK